MSNKDVIKLVCFHKGVYEYKVQLNGFAMNVLSDEELAEEFVRFFLPYVLDVKNSVDSGVDLDDAVASIGEFFVDDGAEEIARIGESIIKGMYKHFSKGYEVVDKYADEE